MEKTVIRSASLANNTEPVERYLARRAEEINDWLDRLVPSDLVPPAHLHRAMRYSLFAGGKRLRPALVLTAGEAFGASSHQLAPAACSIELIHTYSLIHDDLPAMDNDDLRRGRPTCHKVFGDAMAILAGDALLTLAFQILTNGPAKLEPERRLKVIAEVASAAGSVDALIGGQVVDIESEGREIDADTLEYIHRSKTGALLRASVLAGGIIAGADQAQLDALRVYGENVGLAFQIADDILDVTSTREQLGKTPGKDEAALKATYPALYGVEASKQRAAELVDEAIHAISEIAIDSTLLSRMADFMIARRS